MIIDEYINYNSITDKIKAKYNPNSDGMVIKAFDSVLKGRNLLKEKHNELGTA